MKPATTHILFAAGLALAASGPAAAAELRLATPFPANHLMQVHMTGPWAKELAERTNGALQVRFHPGGELGGGTAIYERVRAGVADIGISLQGFTSDQFPRTLLIEIPGVAHDNATAARKLWAAFEHLEPEYPGVKVLALWSTGPYVFMTRRDPVRVVEDVQGKRIRTPSRFLGEVLRAVGASPVSMTITEVYHAMQTGVIDGILSGPSAIEGFKFGEVVRYYTDYEFGVTPLFLVMNQRSYDRLPAEHRRLIDETSGLGLSLRGAEIYDRETVRQLEAEVKTGRGELIQVTEEQRRQWDEAIREVPDRTIAELEAKGIPARRILQAMQDGS